MQSIFQKKSLIISIVFFILSCSVFLFLYKVISNNKETSLLAFEKWHTEETRRNSVRSLADLIKDVEQERASLEKHFVKSSDVVPFLDTIENLAKEVGGKAEMYSVNIINEGSALQVDLKVTGSFSSVYKFINLLENSPYYLKFISADIKNENIGNISAQDGGGKSGVWSARLEINLLSFINR